MKVKEALHNTARTLEEGSIESPLLEAELLLMHAMDTGRTELYVKLEDDLPSRYGDALLGLVDRRLKREPAAYILGHREFYGLDFYVGPGVLIPRPETETLVDAAVAFIHSNFLRSDPAIADIGTGSGAIAVSLARLFPRARVYATDMSRQALDITALNCIRHGVRIEILQGDLLAPLPRSVDVIVANLPYVRDDELFTLEREIKDYEPRIALSGGADGLDVIRRLIVDAREKLRAGGVVLIEIAPSQVDILKAWIARSGLWPCVEPVYDEGGILRVLKLSGI